MPRKSVKTKAAPKATQVTQQTVLAYDLGGTKVAVAIVTPKGKILEEVRVPVVIEQGKEAVLRQLGEIGQGLLKKYPKTRAVGVASAGPLDPKTGELLDPTNFASNEGSWGKVPLAKILKKALKRPVYLDNDAAAAMLAEHWLGAAKGYDDAMILTLGTGLGVGTIANGRLVRAGRGLHPEAGHIIIKTGDESAPCGCGNLGCAEGYLSGRSFTRRSRPRFADPDLTAKDIADLARRRDPRALAAFEEYARLMAAAITTYVVLYSPEIVVFTGSFAATADLFIESTRRHLEEEMLVRRRVGIDLLPKLAVSSLENQAGILGGAYLALHQGKVD